MLVYIAGMEGAGELFYKQAPASCADVKTIDGAGHACLLGNKVILADLLAEWIAQSGRQFEE